MFEIKKIEKKEIWNDFVKKYDYVNILSSWEWIEFEKSLGYEPFPYGVYKESFLVGVFVFRKIDAKRGKYLFLRQNVFLDWDNTDLLSFLVVFLKQEAVKMNTSFFRISPPLLYSPTNENALKDFGFKKSLCRTSDAQLTTVLDLTKSFDVISPEMRKNTRYMIRKGEKLGIEICNLDTDEYLDDFGKMYLETVKRNRWNAESFNYIRKQYLFFAEKGISRMFVAKYKGEILAIAVFTKFNNQVIYHHSASVSEKKNLPAMYVLMWEAIKYYKSLGLNEFNLFGVSEKEESKHPWYGLSLFKRGFGGDERRLVPTYDFPVGVGYYRTYILEKLLN